MISANPPEKWVTFEGTHEAIIDRATWDVVQKIREQRRRPTKMGEMGMFSGITFCADCGAKLYHCRSNSMEYEQEWYTCSSYRTRKGCSAHYIRAVVLEQLVLQNLQRTLAYAQEDEEQFVQIIMENRTAAHRKEREQAKKLLKKQERRISELDSIIRHLYEDNIKGKLTDERFMKLSADYEQEQQDLKKSTDNLRGIVQASEEESANVQNFLKIVRKYTRPEKLMPAILREFVDKISSMPQTNPADTGYSRSTYTITLSGKLTFPRYTAERSKAEKEQQHSKNAMLLPSNQKLLYGAHPFGSAFLRTFSGSGLPGPRYNPR